MSARDVARRTIVSRVAGLLTFGVVVAAVPSCDPIEPRPLTNAPVNRCPCDRYEPGPKTAATCSSGNRCEIATSAGRPEFPFWIVVHVPRSSVFAPGLTYVLVSDAQGSPAFKPPPPAPGTTVTCRAPQCLPLSRLVAATGAYKPTKEVAETLGYPVVEKTSIPARVVYEPLSNDERDTFPMLPLDFLFASSRIGRDGAAQFSRAIPSGRYRRVFYPEPPFDAFFPPRADERLLTESFDDDTFILGGEQLDDVASRTMSISRADGLDGWRAWLVERESQRRVSVLRTLSGVDAEVTLFTSGADRAFQEDAVDVVVAPPESWTAVPRYVTPIFSGQRVSITYASIPPPVAVAGVVAEPNDAAGGVLFGYPAKVTFDSDEIATNTAPSTLLHYSTTVNTDERGRFASVLPPGTYTATVEPAEGTGYATQRKVVVVDRALTALTFQPPPRTLVKGRAVLTDGRALSEAEVVAIPNPSARPRTNRMPPLPRPARTETGADGRFAFELDPGPYVLTVIPKAGTGFPRVVIRPDVPGSLTAQETELPEIRVPAPTRLAFTLRDDNVTRNPIANAIVRVFARPSVPAGTTTLPDPVEIGSAMTAQDGSVEILLAQEPR